MRAAAGVNPQNVVQPRINTDGHGFSELKTECEDAENAGLPQSKTSRNHPEALQSAAPELIFLSASMVFMASKTVCTSNSFMQRMSFGQPVCQ
jgi:hypothetical protein